MSHIIIYGNHKKKDLKELKFAENNIRNYNKLRGTFTWMLCHDTTDTPR